MENKTVLKKDLLDGLIVNSPKEIKKSSFVIPNDLIDSSGILQTVVKKIFKVNTVAGAQNKIAYLRKRQGEIKTFLLNNKYFVKPAGLMSPEKNEEVIQIYKYLESFIEKKIEILKQELEGTQNVFDTVNAAENIINADEVNNLIEERIKNVVTNVPRQKEEEPLVCRKDIARMLSVSLVTINTWMRSGKLPYHRMGSRIYFKKSEVNEAMESSNILKRKKQ